MTRLWTRLTTALGLREPNDPDATPIEDIDADGPHLPLLCPNCGDPIDALVPETDDRVDVGEHARLCRIGTSADHHLAGRAVIHR
ncbi:hypothetical protein ACFQL1_01550 [Halomicroarcula sp. GCM10025709]|uniref:hypothetical protein n=1 Tax=Haloarcula TaxID=2237 RepID=UPI0024C42CE7|nr:hypothetical protein [Halomicroarcula sp. YJ-61-S]